MGWNFRKSFKIAPGVRVNVSKRGISGFTFGKRGASVSTSKRGTHANVGIPGTGLSYRKKLTGGQGNSGCGLLLLAVLGAGVMVSGVGMAWWYWV